MGIDIFNLILYALGIILLVSGIMVLVSYFRYIERNRRLPEACDYLDLKQKNSTLNNENETLHKENKELVKIHREAEEKKAWLEENRSKILSLEADRKKQEEIKASYDGYLDKLSNIIQQCQDKSKELMQIEVYYMTISESIKQLEKKIDESEKQKEDLEIEKRNIQDDLLDIREEHIRLNNEKEQLASEKERLGLETTRLHEKSLSLQKELNEIQMSLDSAARAVTDLEKKGEKLSAAIAEGKKTREELDSRNAALMKENEIWAIDNENAVRKLRELQDAVGTEDDRLQNITAEYTVKKCELETFQTQKETLEKQIDFLKESLEKMRQDAARNNGLTSEDDTLKDLWEPVIFPILAPPEKEKSEADLLEETKQYIRGKKLYFPDRVLHAFHTAMKCNDISPITVLAGISGTGKSELPKCYAEGMGMHFSILAVQPRWDSPQDLLGFYNYMENKYKATELARAMVRFDMFNRRDWGGIPDTCDDRSDRMLLVLLDEMNLARVEYYFSEFLSKLETRRGVEIGDARERAKAEIELELIGRTPLRIFPGRNILFTGTMNEDESTQTLSDKVLDRANVLRFGKPKNTDISDKLRNSKATAPRAAGITYECWQNWCVDAKDVKMDEQLSIWINTLNNAMEEIQKPFGHRVAQAIAAYVANYPEYVPRRRELAFADQIEQRIMPKLRGIDIEEHEGALRRISKLIGETNDDALVRAFEKGRQNTANGIFMWHGVDRSEEH